MSQRRLTPERLSCLMAYMRLTELAPGERELLETLYLSAVGYLEGAGVSAPEEGSLRAAQFDLCAYYLVLDAYDRRDRSVNEELRENPAFRMLLNQLKLTEGS